MAEEAERMGMIFKVFTDEEFEARSREIVFALASMPTRGLAYTKQLLSRSFTNSLDEQLAEEDVFQQKAGVTEDYREGISAFLEKRAPVFKGK
jgi:2-(1,2-epoxy-1,2-dihydrophenyl)acetyl-CoA isomerase